MEIEVAEFSPEHLRSRCVQGFECGDTLWAQHAAKWIKSAPPFEGALKSIRDRGNVVWLYFALANAIDEKHLVGFSSLGVIRWPIPPPDGPKRDVGFIPMLAVASAFQGKPNGADGKHYSHFIMEDVIRKARARKYRELCLFAHEDNVRAIKLYEEFGFEVIQSSDGKGNVKMMAFLDSTSSQTKTH